MLEEAILNGILDGKEERVLEQQKILKRYKRTLISFTLNIPGANKRGLKYKKVFEIGVRRIKSILNEHKLKIVHTLLCDNMAGYMFFCSVEEQAMIIKSLMIQLEDESSLGRIFDIDVFNKNGELLSRSDFKIVKRKCLICDKDAVVCSRTREHSMTELLGAINIIINDCLDKEELYGRCS